MWVEKDDTEWWGMVTVYSYLIIVFVSWEIECCWHPCVYCPSLIAIEKVMMWYSLGISWWGQLSIAIKRGMPRIKTQRPLRNGSIFLNWDCGLQKRHSACRDRSLQMEFNIGKHTCFWFMIVQRLLMYRLKMDDPRTSLTMFVADFNHKYFCLGNVWFIGSWSYTALK